MKIYIFLIALFILGIRSNAQQFSQDKAPDNPILPSSPNDQLYCSSFYPIAGKTYIVSAWVKEEVTNVATYSDNVYVRVRFFDQDEDPITNFDYKAYVKGAVIDGWQRIIGKFTVPPDAISFIKIELENENTSIDAYFDDVRIFPFNGTLKSFVYNEDTQRLMAELDENNYTTYYEYDQEGGLIRVKKETEKGVYTIQETRSGNVKQDN